MDVLQTLGVALGLATLAGVNLYLTVFAASLAIHFQWVALPSQLHELSVLGDPWIMVISGLLYFLGFFADKIPWIDSANDAVHTFVRPLGGAVLAVLALGDAHPTVKVVAALLAGGVALTSHTAKAATRLVANTSPEPVSNVGLSLGEDALVLGGLGLVFLNPIVALVVSLVFLAVIWFILPRILRSIRTILWLAWKKLNGPASGQESDEMGTWLPANCELALRRAHATADTVAFAVPCLSGGGPRLPKNRRGWLVRFESGRVFFINKRWHGSLVVEIPRTGNSAPIRESRFLCERLAIPQASGELHVFLFERGQRLLADRVAAELKANPTAPQEKPEPAMAA